MTATAPSQLDLRPGDWVEVRSAAEILATLDDQAALEGLLFMPEMLACCGQRFRVYKRADKTCDTIHLTGMMRMQNTVHLEMTRCDGAAHGGCQAACMFFWKERWLRRVGDDGPADSEAGNGQAATRPVTSAARDRAWLEATTQREPAEDGEARYRCQATELKSAACPLKWWGPTQYVRDIRTNDWPVNRVFKTVGILVFNKVLRRLGKWQYPSVVGKLKRTPSEVLDLQVGEWVVVKSRQEIVTTLDGNGKNRGMTFEPEMIPYCDKCYRVIQRVDRIIEEGTGRMKELNSVGIILENVICASTYRTPCPRANYLYWREIWLRRALPHEIPQDAQANGLCVLQAPCV
ncbi:MAG: hypothetical protein AB7O59_15430 [Pirellulales bacterium]